MKKLCLFLFVICLIFSFITYKTSKDETHLPITYASNVKEELIPKIDETNEELFILNTPTIDLKSLPEYCDVPYIEINHNIPYFTSSQITDQPFEYYSELDDLGRVGVAYACLDESLMPKEKRGSIGMIKPSGFVNIRYDDLITDKYLYNRCHLIGYQLTGENANINNLMTGTRYMNVEGMLPFENQTADYIKKTHHHVMYRVTPLFFEDNLVAHGVLMEAQSVEDNELSFNVFVYNVQPHIGIHYEDGSSYRLDENTQEVSIETKTYVLNKNTKKFHEPSCKDVQKIKDKNKIIVEDTYENIVSEGYQGCKKCNPD